MTSEVVVSRAVPLVMLDGKAREEWLNDPVLNLCASTGIERAAANRLRPHSPSWLEQIARYNALLDALRRIVNCDPRTWTLALLEVENAKTVIAEAWTTAVVLADSLGLMDEWADGREVK